MNPISNEIESLVFFDYGYHTAVVKDLIFIKHGILVNHFNKKLSGFTVLEIQGNNNSAKIFDNDNFNVINVII